MLQYELVELRGIRLQLQGSFYEVLSDICMSYLAIQWLSECCSNQIIDFTPQNASLITRYKC